MFKTCDKCYHVEQQPTGECYCTVDFEEVNASDEFECFVSRSEKLEDEAEFWRD